VEIIIFINGSAFGSGVVTNNSVHPEKHDVHHLFGELRFQDFCGSRRIETTPFRTLTF